jgi:hypothetical protein
VTIDKAPSHSAGFQIDFGSLISRQRRQALDAGSPHRTKAREE